jgi:RNA polymerase sigma-70 factor (ECF subfamily)
MRWPEAGDERAFRELYRRHTPALYQLVLRMLGGVASDAEDVVQETLDSAPVRQALEVPLGIEPAHMGHGDRAQSGARGAAQAARARAPKSSDEHPGLSTRPVRDADRIDLERAIARLPNGYRAVLVLHDVEGFTHEEIGRQLGDRGGHVEEPALRRAPRDPQPASIATGGAPCMMKTSPRKSARRWKRCRANGRRIARSRNASCARAARAGMLERPAVLRIALPPWAGSHAAAAP